MKRTTLHLLVDAGLALGGLALLSTGLLIEFVLPPHSGQATAWGLTRHDWGEVHFWIAMAMLGLLALHVTLNWGWVCNVAGKLCGRQARGPLGWRKHVAGAVALLVVVTVVGGFLWAASVAKEPGVGGGGGRGGDGFGRGAWLVEFDD